MNFYLLRYVRLAYSRHPKQHILRRLFGGKLCMMKVLDTRTHSDTTIVATKITARKYSPRTL